MHVDWGRGRQPPVVKLFSRTQIFHQFGHLLQVFPLYDFVTDCSIKCTGDQICPWRKIGHGQPRVIIYINFVELESPMLHAKFHGHRTFGSVKVFTIYGNGYDLDHLYKLSSTLPMYIPHEIWL